MRDGRGIGRELSVEAFAYSNETICAFARELFIAYDYSLHSNGVRPLAERLLRFSHYFVESLSRLRDQIC